MSHSSKLNPSLRALVEKVAPADPTFEVELVISPSEEEVTQTIADRIDTLGGKVDELRTGRLECRLPVGKVLDLADQEAVSSIRLRRLHRMHSKKI